jgi:hypothetical protein
MLLEHSLDEKDSLSAYRERGQCTESVQFLNASACWAGGGGALMERAL